MDNIMIIDFFIILMLVNHLTSHFLLPQGEHIGHQSDTPDIKKGLIVPEDNRSAMDIWHIISRYAGNYCRTAIIGRQQSCWQDGLNIDMTLSIVCIASKRQSYIFVRTAGVIIIWKICRLLLSIRMAAAWDMRCTAMILRTMMWRVDFFASHSAQGCSYETATAGIACMHVKSYDTETVP